MAYAPTDWRKSDIYPQWDTGSGVYREVVVGRCANGDYARYSKGRPFGHKKYYDRGSFGLHETAVAGEYNHRYIRSEDTNKAYYDDCFNYALGIQNQPDFDGKLDVNEDSGSNQSDGGNRGQRASTNVPIILIVSAIIALITIIYWLK